MKDEKLMAHDPLSDADTIMSDEFYGAAGDTAGPRRRPRASTGPKPERPTHYKVICISMYTKDIQELDAKVAELKKRGWTKASKSQLIRIALERIDLDSLVTPRQ